MGLKRNHKQFRMPIQQAAHQAAAGFVRAEDEYGSLIQIGHSCITLAPTLENVNRLRARSSQEFGQTGKERAMPGYF